MFTFFRLQFQQRYSTFTAHLDHWTCARADMFHVSPKPNREQGITGTFLVADVSLGLGIVQLVVVIWGFGQNVFEDIQLSICTQDSK